MLATETSLQFWQICTFSGTYKTSKTWNKSISHRNKEHHRQRSANVDTSITRWHMSHDKNSKIRKFKVADGRHFQNIFLYHHHHHHHQHHHRDWQSIAVSVRWETFDGRIEPVGRGMFPGCYTVHAPHLKIKGREPSVPKTIFAPARWHWRDTA